MTPKQEAAIRRHGERLLAIFPEATERDPLALCRALRRLEGRAHAIALRLCNGPEFDYPDQADRKLDGILDRVHQLLGASDSPVPIFVNRDPRGYALKIPDTWLCENMHGEIGYACARLHHDWGGYGILAPEIGPNGE